MILSSPSELREEALVEWLDEPSTANPAPWATGPTLRDLRASALERARYYRNAYWQERMGYQRRILRKMLNLARDYRAAERNV